MIGNFGFDLVTWEVLKGFIDTRNKVLALTDHVRFDPRSQILRLIPEPTENLYIPGYSWMLCGTARKGFN